MSEAPQPPQEPSESTPPATQESEVGQATGLDPLTEEPRKQSNLHRFLPIVIASVVALLIGGSIGYLIGSGNLGGNNAAKDKLANAHWDCDAYAGFEYDADDASLSFDMKGEDDSNGASYADLDCVFEALDMPSHIINHMDQTTSMDGRQTETWDKYEVQWSYHPDRGLDGQIVLK